MFVISTVRGAICKVPMKPRFVPTFAVKFSGAVDDSGWVLLGEFEDF